MAPLEKHCFPLTVDTMIPSAGQGTIAIEKRSDDQKMADICKEINHLPSWYLSQAEREFLVYFDASCKTPIAAHAEYIDELIIIDISNKIIIGIPKPI